MKSLAGDRDRGHNAEQFVGCGRRAALALFVGYVCGPLTCVAAAGDELEEVVVTAEKRTGSAQTTPISMYVYDSAALAAAGVGNMQSLSATAPAVNYSQSDGGGIVTIRGISSRDLTEIGDPAVAVSTDGFYRNRSYALAATLYDLERIEVLLGPQGTLYGRNTTGGAINIITAKPAKDLAGETAVTVGNYNTLNVEGMLNAPLAEGLLARAAFATRSHDGYVNNSPQPNGDDEDSKSARLALAYSLSDRFHSLLTLQFTTIAGVGQAVYYIPFVYAPDGGVVHNMPAFAVGARAWSPPLPTDTRLTDKTAQWSFSYDWDAVTVTYLGGIDSIDYVRKSNQSSPGTLQWWNPHEYPKTQNHEVRLTGTLRSNLLWQAGFFYFNEDSSLYSYNSQPDSQGGPENRLLTFDDRVLARSAAGFGQITYVLPHGVRLTAGARYNYDKKREDGVIDFNNASTPPISYDVVPQYGSASWTKTTYHVGADWAVTKESFLYAKVDTGYKPGGFTDLNSYGPETVRAYEVGAKNRFWGDTLQVNVDAYSTRYEGQQVSQNVDVGGGGTVILNAGKTRIRGGDLDLLALIPVVGRLRASVGYLDARFQDFLVAYAAQNLQLAGNRPPQAPVWSVGLGLERSWELPFGKLRGSVSSKYQSAQHMTFYNFPDDLQRSYSTTDAEVTYVPRQHRWQVQLYGRNLENTRIFVDAEESGFNNSYQYSYAAPRTFGVRIVMDW